MPRTSKSAKTTRKKSAKKPTLERDARQPLFEQLAARIEELIHSGTLKPGERVPSVRRAQAQFDVSASTVVEAYRLLEARGLIRSRPQSGSYVRESAVHAKNLPSATKPRLRSIILEPPEPMLVRLKAAVPHASLLPLAQITKTLGQVYRDHPENLSKYADPQGARELRHEIARRMMDAGCSVAEDEVVVTHGATEALNIALAVTTKPGDLVAVESPTYHGILSAMRGRGLRALPIAACPQDGLCVEAFAKAAGRYKIGALVVVPTHSNPLGGCLSLADRQRLVEIARAHQIPIIEDDVYGELSFVDERPPALKSLDADVIYCSSFSKVLAPGLRLGWCLPGPRQADFQQQKIGMTISSSLAPQLAIAQLLAGGGFDRHLRRLRRHYKTLLTRFREQVLASFPRGTCVARPQGGQILWVEMPKAVDSLLLHETAEREGITFAPGPVFCPEGGYRNFLRLNCAVPWNEEIARAIATLGRLANEQIEARNEMRDEQRPLTTL